MASFRENRPGEILLETAADVVPQVLAQVRPQLAEAEQRGLEISRVMLMLDEMVSNIYRHGYHKRAGQPIGIRIRFEGDLCQIAVRDLAPTFDCVEYAKTRALPDPRLGKPGGMGLIIMQELCESFVHQVPSNGGNALYMTIRLRPRSVQTAGKSRT
jgi:anti-sigma regulatory factor (Ser/Thr protein kinase)